MPFGSAKNRVQPSDSKGGQGAILAGSAFQALTIRATGIVFTFLFTLLIAWLVGPRGAGVYFSFLGIVSVATIVVRQGLDLALLKKIAILADQSDWPAISSLYHGATKALLITSALTLVSLVAGLKIAGLKLTDEFAPLILFMIFALPGLAHMNLSAEVLKALGKTNLSVVVLTVTPAVCSFAFVWPLFHLLGISGLGLAFCAACTVAALIGFMLSRRFISAATTDMGPHPDLMPILKDARSLYYLSVINRGLLPWAVFPVLQLLTSPEEVGLFGIAMRLAMLVGVPLVCLEAVLAPRFAAQYARGDHHKLREFGQKAAIYGVIVTSPAIVFVMFPGYALSFFGTEFVDAAPALMCLTCAHFANVALGSPGIALMMTNHGSRALWASLVALGVQVVLLMVLVPDWGATGAGIATATAMLVNRLALSALLLRETGLILTPLFTIFGFNKVKRL